MELIRTTLPGHGHIHHAHTRDGHVLSVAVTHDGRRELAFYADDDSDTPVQTIRLEREEADAIAQLLHDEPLMDRLAALEREVARLSSRV